MLFRCLVDGCFIVPVTFSALASFAKHEFLTVFGQVADGFEIDPLIATLEFHGLRDSCRVTAVDYSSGWHTTDLIFRGSSVFACTHTVFTRFADEFGVVGISF